MTSFVFQYLDFESNRGVYTMITRSIRLHLYKDGPKNENDVFSSKYLHIASITKMATHQGVDIFKGHA